MADQNEQQRTAIDSIEEHERYLLRSRAEIVRSLAELAKRPDIVTAYFNEGKEYFLTAVVSVLAERDLVVLDYGASETVNKRALAARRLVCVTKHNNIAVRFTLEGVKRARMKGEPVFAAPLPQSLFRLQRREFFRIDTPLTTPITCRIPQAQGKADLELPVVDISCGGIGLVDPSMRLEMQPLQLLHGCRIEIPDVGTLTVDLEVRNQFKQQQNDGTEANRIGCAFAHLNMEQNTIIQRYINRLQIERRGIGG